MYFSAVCGITHTCCLFFFLLLLSFLSSCLVHLLCAHEACPLCCSWQQLIHEVCACVCVPKPRCVCVTRFPKPVVIGESLQRIPASSLVAARALAMAAGGSCQETGAGVERVRGSSSSSALSGATALRRMEEDIRQRLLGA